MGKRLDITPEIAASIARSTDNSVNPEEVAVFETVSLNTLPIRKKGTIFDGAIATESLLQAMADFTNTPPGFVPLHTNHQQGEEMPIGRVFEAQMGDAGNGVKELRSMFYLPLSEATLINKVDTGVIEEVSVGVRSKHLNCSECGFDFLGAESTSEHIWSKTCENGHVIGEGGVHVNMSGLDRYFEQSLVSIGAANNAKIQSRTKARMGKEQYDQQLAATGVPPGVTTLYASPTIHKEQSMDLTELVAQLTTAKADNQVKEAAVKKADETVVALNASVAALQDEVNTLKGAADIKLPEVQAQLDAATQALVDATAVMRSEADRLSVAASLDKPAADASLIVLVEAITSARTKLAASIPVGGVALSSGAGTGEKAASAQVSSFKTRS